MRTHVLVLAAAVAVSGCTTAAPRRSAASASPEAATASVSTAQQVLSAMNLRERVGQLLMVGVPTTGLTAADRTALSRYHVGSVILDGNTTAGRTAVLAVASSAQRLAPATAKLFVATDQEGGLVQRLRGTGFSTIPSALTQGGIAPTTLQEDWRKWARQLRYAGINLDLAPVLDTVPAGAANPPIGDLNREFGHNTATVTSHGVAALRGMATASVDATVKHFPGIGRVTGNTDTTSGVTDRVTTRHDPYLAPFTAAIKAGTPFVMVSTVIYSRIDAHEPAVFSSVVVTDMLRGDLGFHGVVISDDLGNAAQVRGYRLSTRAIAFIRVGGDVILTVDATQTAAMSDALVAEAEAHPLFRDKVDVAALRVLEAKQARGLLG